MAILGGIKFFEPSQNLAKDGAIISATSGQPSAVYAIDRNPLTYWRSVSSNDTVSEVVEVDFQAVVTIDRILLLDLNWKQFVIKYDLLGVWTDFAAVVGMDGSLATISETAFADNSGYYEFTPVTTGKIQISILKTQTADQDKYVSQIICTSEIGTLQGFPSVDGITSSRNSRNSQTLSGKYIIQKSDESMSFGLDFKSYPANSAVYRLDLDLMMTLFDRDLPFITWLCGGRRGTRYFSYTLRGFRLKDAYTMQISKDFGLSYNSSVYTLQVNNKIQLEEHI